MECHKLVVLTSVSSRQEFSLLGDNLTRTFMHDVKSYAGITGDDLILNVEFVLKWVSKISTMAKKCGKTFKKHNLLEIESFWSFFEGMKYKINLVR